MSSLIVGGSGLHKTNFIKQLNREGWSPDLEDGFEIDEDDNIQPYSHKTFCLTSSPPEFNLPDDWDEAMNAFRNSP